MNDDIAREKWTAPFPPSLLQEPSLGSDAEEFELKLRQLIDAKYDRPVDPENPFLALAEDRLPVTKCREVFGGWWDSLMVFNRVLLPRLLEKAPSVAVRVELMGVIAQEYGPHLKDAHPMLLRDFLLSLGVPESSLVWDCNLEDGPAAAEARMMRDASFVELLARILVGESLGPVVFPMIAESLSRSYNLSGRALAYFQIHAIADKKDAKLLFGMLRREAKTLADRQAVFNMVEKSFEQGRYKLYGCKLPRTTDYRYAPLFER